jgi:hypothetical protein
LDAKTARNIEVRDELFLLDSVVTIDLRSPIYFVDEDILSIYCSPSVTKQGYMSTINEWMDQSIYAVR